MTALSIFVGRDADVARLVEIASGSRLVTVIGPGGVGKTRIVNEAVPLLRATLGATTHHLSLSGLAAGADGARLCTHLGVASAEAFALSIERDDAVVVVDNCDLVTAAAADFVERLIRSSSTVRVVATSREPLGISGERLMVIEPLDRESAIELFLDRAESAGAAWERSVINRQIVGDICADLDSLPLALELAAARSRMFSPTELRALMSRRLEILQRRPSPGHTTADRHASMRATIEDSFDLLDTTIRKRLRQLSVFSGPFAATTAHDVFGDGAFVDTLDVLSVLVDRSLLVAEPRGTTRYRLLELIREYAAEDMHAAGESEQARQRLTDAMAEAADRIVTVGTSRWTADVLAGVSTLAADLIAAIDWCIAHDSSADRAIRLFLPLLAVIHQSRAAEVRAVGERLFARWPEPAPMRAEAVAVLANGCAVAQETARAEQLAREAAADPAITALGRVLVHRAQVLACIGRDDAAAAYDDATAGAAEARAAGLDPFARELLAFRALAIEARGAPADADALARSVADESDLAHDPITEVWALLVAANIAGRDERWSDVRTLVDRAQATSIGLADGWWNGAIFRSRALCAGYEAASTSMLDGWDESTELWAAVIDRAVRGGDLAEVAVTLRIAAAIALKLERVDAARALGSAVPALRELAVLPPISPEPSTGMLASSDVPLVDAVHDALASILVASEPSPPVVSPAAAAPSGADGRTNSIDRVGDTWSLTYAGATAYVRDLKGMPNLVSLLLQPDHEVHCLELMGGSDVGGSSGPPVDDIARRQYRERILELQADIDDARDANDLGRAELAEAELDALVEQLSEAFGLGGRSRAVGSSSQRARSAATYRLRAAIKSVAAVHPDLGRHLENSVRTGTWCAYRPETEVVWSISS